MQGPHFEWSSRIDRVVLHYWMSLRGYSRFHCDAAFLHPAIWHLQYTDKCNRFQYMNIFFFLFVVPCVFVPFLKIGKYTNNDNIDWNLKNRCSQERRIKKRVISLWAKSTQISHIYPRIRYESLQCSATSDFRWERCSVFIISYT